MSEFKTALHQQVRYVLRHDIKGKLDVDKGSEPKGWDSDLKDIILSTEHAGVLNKITVNLEFKKEVGDWIYSTYKTYGWNTRIYLSKYVMHPTKIEEISYYKDVILNGNTLKKSGTPQGRTIKIDAQESALNSVIKSKKSEIVEIDALQTLGGKVLPALTRSTFNFHGLDIELKSTLTRNDDNIVINYPTSGTGNSGSTYRAKPLPLEVVTSDDPNVQDVTNLNSVSQGGGDGSNYLAGNQGSMFYLLNDRDRTLPISFDIDVELYTNTDCEFFKLDLVTYENGSNFDFKSKIELDRINNATINDRLFYQADLEVPLLEGESLALVVFIKNNNFFTIYNNINHRRCNISIKENSFKPATNHDTVLAFDYFNRILQIITDRTDTVLYSDYFSPGGEGAAIGFAVGFWIRNFTDRPLSTSWEKSFNSLKILKGLEFGIDTINGKEMVVVEKEDFFKQDKKVIKFPNPIQKVVRSPLVKQIYSSLDIGYLKGGDGYENANGLTEPMGRHSYNFPIDSVENKLQLISDLRADPTGAELIRRKPAELFPTEDTDSDSDIWVFDMKPGNAGIYDLKRWQDDFDTEPTGLFSPETYFNLTLTPKQLLYTNSRKINVGLSVYQNESIIFKSAIGNTDLVLQNGGVVMGERSDVPINTLPKPRHKDEIVNFEHPINFALQEQIEGRTEVNGRLIPNMYFLAEVYNPETKKKELVRLTSVKPEGSGKLKSITVNG